MEQCVNFPSEHWFLTWNSIPKIPIKHDGRIDIFGHARPQKMYFPYAFSHKVTGQCAYQNKQRGRQDGKKTSCKTGEIKGSPGWVKDELRMIAGSGKKRTSSSDWSRMTPEMGRLLSQDAWCHETWGENDQVSRSISFLCYFFWPWLIVDPLSLPCSAAWESISLHGSILLSPIPKSWKKVPVSLKVRKAETPPTTFPTIFMLGMQYLALHYSTIRCADDREPHFSLDSLMAFPTHFSRITSWHMNTDFSQRLDHFTSLGTFIS